MKMIIVILIFEQNISEYQCNHYRAALACVDFTLNGLSVSLQAVRSSETVMTAIMMVIYHL